MREKIKKGNLIKNIFKVSMKIFYNLLIVLCVLLILVILLQRITDSSGSLAGYRIFRVVTGSMIPQYDVGEVVVCKEIEASQIKIGDDIVYKGSTGELRGKIIMHEVVEIEVNQDNNLVFHAKGISNTKEDPDQIREDQIYGVVKFKSGILTVLYKLATSIYSSFIIITILVINVFISFKVTEKRDVVQELETGNEEEKENKDKTTNKGETRDIEKQKDDIDLKEIEFEEIELEDEDSKGKDKKK